MASPSPHPAQLSRLQSRPRADTARRLDLLLDVGQLVRTASGEADLIRALARRMAGPLADLCMVEIFDAQGTLQREALAHVDPELEVLAWELRAGGLLGPGLLGEKTRLHAELTREQLQRVARGPDQLRLLRALAPGSLLVVPIPGVRRAWGALSLLVCRGRAPYGQPDQRLAEDVAARLGNALDAMSLGRESALRRTHLEEQAVRSAILSSVTSALDRAGLDVHQIFESLVRTLAETLGDGCAAWRWPRTG